MGRTLADSRRLCDMQRRRTRPHFQARQKRALTQTGTVMQSGPCPAHLARPQAQAVCPGSPMRWCSGACPSLLTLTTAVRAPAQTLAWMTSIALLPEPYWPCAGPIRQVFIRTAARWIATALRR